MHGGCPPKPWRRRARFGGFRRSFKRDHGCKAVGLHSSLLRNVDEAVEGCAVTVLRACSKEERLQAFVAEATSAELEDMVKEVDAHIDWIESQQGLITQVGLENYLSEQIRKEI
jgi:hypothetical protein